jgi:hypothetical protein
VKNPYTEDALLDQDDENILLRLENFVFDGDEIPPPPTSSVSWTSRIPSLKRRSVRSLLRSLRKSGRRRSPQNGREA